MTRNEKHGLKENIEGFLRRLWETVEERGWDQPCSLHLIQFEEGTLTSSTPVYFEENPKDFLECKYAPDGIDAAALFFEGWTYPEPLSREDAEEQHLLTPPSAHPARVEMRQAILMTTTGVTYAMVAHRGNPADIQRVNDPNAEVVLEVAGTIVGALRCYLRTPYHKDVPSPYQTWARNLAGGIAKTTTSYATTNKLSQEQLNPIVVNAAELILAALTPEKAPDPRTARTLTAIKEEQQAPNPTRTWNELRSDLIASARHNFDTQREEWLNWVDDALLQETLDDLHAETKVRTLSALVENPHTKRLLDDVVEELHGE